MLWLVTLHFLSGPCLRTGSHKGYFSKCNNCWLFCAWRAKAEVRLQAPQVITSSSAFFFFPGTKHRMHWQQVELSVQPESVIWWKWWKLWGCIYSWDFSEMTAHCLCDWLQLKVDNRSTWNTKQNDLLLTERKPRQNPLTSVCYWIQNKLLGSTFLFLENQDKTHTHIGIKPV